MLENPNLERDARRALRGGFVRDGAIVFASWMLINVLSYAIHFVLSRRLGISDYGAFASIIAVLAIFGIPAAIATMVVVKFVAEFHAVDDRGKIRTLSVRVLTGSGILSALVVFLAIAFRWQIAGYLHLSATAEVVAASCALGGGLLLPAVRAVLQGTQDFVAFAISISIDAVARVGLAVALVYAGYGVTGAFAAYAVASFLSLGYTLAAASGHWENVRAPLAIGARRLFATMGGAIVGTAAITFMGYIDVTLVKHFFSVTDAGIYSAASFGGKMLFFVVGFVPLLILPKAAQHAVAGKPARTILMQGVALTAALAGVGLAVFYLVPQIVIRITYGAAFIGAAPYLFEYGVAMSLLGITNVVVTYKVGLHRFGFVGPLLAMAVIEPLAIAFFHPTLNAVIHVLLAANAAALLFCLIDSPKARLLGAVVAADSGTAPDYTASA
jgi:O-antigen/teichoic acid export membrane protein